MLRPRHAPGTCHAGVQKTGTGSTIEKQYTKKNRDNASVCYKRLAQEKTPVAKNATVGESQEAGQNLALVIMSTPLVNAPQTTRRQKTTRKTLEKV